MIQNCHRCKENEADINLCLVHDMIRGTCFDIKVEWKDYLCKSCHMLVFGSISESISYQGVEDFKEKNEKILLGLIGSVTDEG